MTHLVIPIEEIKEKITHYKQVLGILNDALIYKGHDYYRVEGFLATYENLLNTAKQISLE